MYKQQIKIKLGNKKAPGLGNWKGLYNSLYNPIPLLE